MQKRSHTASNQLTRVLVRQIMDEELPAGQRLPTEQVLAEENQVSRHLVREALKRLEALSLITIQQGSGAYVLDVSRIGGVELLEYILFDEAGGLNLDVAMQYATFGSLLLSRAALLAARNRTDEQVQQLRVLVASRDEANLNFDKVIAFGSEFVWLFGQASHNRVFQLVLNNLGRVLKSTKITELPFSGWEPILTTKSLDQLVDAVEAHDEQLALLLTERAIDKFMERVKLLASFLSVFDNANE